jgi:serine/threonine protein kinase
MSLTSQVDVSHAPCPELRDQIEALFECRLSDTQMVEVESHLATCEGCRQQLADLVAEHVKGGVDSVLDWERSLGGTVESLTDRPHAGRDPRDARVSLWDRAITGRTVGKYQIQGLIGKGGMASVYQAVDTVTGRRVALKMVQSQSSAGSQPARLLNEARAMALLSHPSIVQVFDVMSYDEQPILVMELVDGETLESWQSRTPIDIHCAARLIKDMAEAISTAHAQGVIHRDLKPANILVPSGSVTATEAGRDSWLQLKIADFGISRVLGDDGWRLTQTGGRLGTPAYMSPEQAAGPSTELGPATDIYSLGAILYQLLTGLPPFVSQDPLQLLQMIRRDQPVAPGLIRGDLAADLETICLKCLDKQPRHRYLSADELSEDLGRFLEGRPIRARPVGICGRSCHRIRRHPGLFISISVGAVLLLLLAVGGLLTGLSQRKLAERARTAQLLAENRQAAAQRTWIDAFHRTEQALIRIINLDWAPESYAQRDEAQRLMMELFAGLHRDYLVQRQHDRRWGFIEVNALCNLISLSRKSDQGPVSDPQTLAWLTKADRALRRIEQSPQPEQAVTEHQELLGSVFGASPYRAAPARLLVDHRVSLNHWLAELAGNAGNYQRKVELLSQSAEVVLKLVSEEQSNIGLHGRAGLVVFQLAEGAWEANELTLMQTSIQLAVTHRRLASDLAAEDMLVRFELVDTLVSAAVLARKAGMSVLAESYAAQAREAADADLMSSLYGEHVERIIASLPNAEV